MLSCNRKSIGVKYVGSSEQCLEMNGHWTLGKQSIEETCSKDLKWKQSRSRSLSLIEAPNNSYHLKPWFEISHTQRYIIF